MSNYLVETFYTCSFKIIHKLDDLNEKNLSELENRKDGKFEVIEIKLDNRKTKIVNKEESVISSHNPATKNIPDLSTIVSEKISSSESFFSFSSSSLWTILNEHV